MFKNVKKCRFCESNLIVDVLDLGNQPLANGLLKKIKKKIQKKNFLKMIICKSCKLLQLSCTVKPELLFKNYLWVTGTSNKVKNYREFFFKKLSKYSKLRKNL